MLLLSCKWRCKPACKGTGTCAMLSTEAACQAGPQPQQARRGILWQASAMACSSPVRPGVVLNVPLQHAQLQVPALHTNAAFTRSALLSRGDAELTSCC